MAQALEAIALFGRRMSLNLALSIQKATAREGASPTMRTPKPSGERSAASGSASPIEAYDRIIEEADENFRRLARDAVFDDARRRAIAASLQWLERDPLAARGIACALSPPDIDADPTPSGSAPAGGSSAFSSAVPVLTLEGGDILFRRRACAPGNPSALIIPGFLAGSSLFDLDPEYSAMATLARHGIDTWILERRRSADSGRSGTLSQLIEDIDRALDAVHRLRAGPAAKALPRPALIGHFHGGTLALLHCLRHPGKASALITLSTPIDFATEDDLFSHWIRSLEGERLIDVFGDLPGGLPALLAAAVSPMRNFGQSLLALPETMGRLRSPRSKGLEFARRNAPGFPGRCFLSLQRMLYRDNALMTGTLESLDRYDDRDIDGCSKGDGRSSSLDALERPILNLVALDDRIVPPVASRPLARIAPKAPYRLLEYRGGHFDLFTDESALDRLFGEIAAWIGRAAGEGSPPPR